MKILTSILILMTIMSCNSQNKVKQKKTMKTFDIETFEKNKVGNEYLYELNNNIQVKEIAYGDGSFYQSVKKENAIFQYIYIYHSNGRLKLEGKSFIKQFDIGIWKEYDKQGNLIKEEDLDKPFTYSWEDVKKYLKAHHVDDIKKDVIDISRWSDDKEATWTLEFNGKYKGIKGRLVITLNGKTGEELEVKLFKGKKAIGKDGTGSDYEILYTKKEKE